MPNNLSKPTLKAIHLKTMRLKAFRNQFGRCYYCERPIWINGKEGFAIKYSIPLSMVEKYKCTAEHLVARCDGGGDNQSNIVAACFFCNNSRHHGKCAPSPSKYKELVQRWLNEGKWHEKSPQRLAAHSM